MKNSKPKILILDGDHKNALAIIRHLGKSKEYILDVVSHSKASIGFFSKYVNTKSITHSPKKDAEAFLADITNILSKTNYAVIIPVSYISCQICSNNRAQIERHTKITIASPEAITLASSKVETYKLAEKLGIPYPKVYKINNTSDLDSLDTAYPCVIKAPFEAGKNIVEYAQNKKDLITKFEYISNNYDFDGIPPVVQRFIIGEGVGFFAFYKDGKCINYFIHRRIREYPVTGGASTVAESFYDDEIIKMGQKILDHLKWEGVAMVEFKKDNSTGIYNLMEINAKFWGSLDLALKANVNFPKMLIDNALNNKIITNNDFDYIKYQWILNGDLFHLFEKPSIFFAFFKDLFTSKNDFYLSDIKPNLFQLVFIPIHYYKKWFK